MPGEGQTPFQARLYPTADYLSRNTEIVRSDESCQQHRRPEISPPRLPGCPPPRTNLRDLQKQSKIQSPSGRSEGQKDEAVDVVEVAKTPRFRRAIDVVEVAKPPGFSRSGTRLCPKRGLTLWRTCRISNRLDMSGEGQTPFGTEPRYNLPRKGSLATSTTRL